MNKIEKIYSVSKVFTPTSPVDEKALFAGRHAQLSLVIDAINQKGQHAVIYGERGVGKTSLANVLASFLPVMGAKNAITPRVNCDSTDTYESVFDKAFQEIRLVQQTKGIGFTADNTNNIIDGRSFIQGAYTSDNVRRAFTVLSQHYQLVIILDEFDRLTDKVKHSLADTIKTLSDHAVDATIIMVGVADSVGELIKEHASVERAIVQIPMPRMSRAEISEIVLKGCDLLAMKIEEEAKHSIETLSQGLPHYTHLICLHSARECLESDATTINQKHVDAAIQKALASSQHSIQSAYHVATMSPRKDNLFANVLLACALAPVDQLGYFAAQDIRAPMQEISGKNYEIPSFSQHLNDFCDSKRGPILKKIGTARRYRFRFINPLLQPYVIMQGCKSGKYNLAKN